MKNLSIDTLSHQIYDPDKITSPVVFASPHSGRQYSKAFLDLSVLDEHAIRTSEDAYVDQLLDFVPKLGCPLLLANAPRAYVDLNRSNDELDPALIADLKRTSPNPRVASGLGVIPRVVANSREIYKGKLSRQEAVDRLETIWKPYHKALRRLMNRARDMFGYVILIDVHSMPHEAVAYLSRPHLGTQIVLGDRFGASAGLEMSESLEASFEVQSFKVSRNVPFAGAFITQEYGQPTLGYHAIQIEIDRALYLKKHCLELREDVNDLKHRLRAVFEQVVEQFASYDMRRLAAE